MIQNRNVVKKIFVFFAAFLWLGAFASTVQTEEGIKNEDCLACHDSFHYDKFLSSVHRSNLCTSCHADIKEIPHPEKLAPVNCAHCHRLESEVYDSSDHGMAVKWGAPAASCLSCHGNPHELLSARDPQSPVYRLNIPKTCATCHEDQKKMAKYSLLEKQPVKSYLDTVHGKALEKGHIQSAVCSDCHGSHDLHAPTNPKSKIYRSNVPSTCGKCHENVLRTYERSIHGKAVLAGKREAPVCTDCHGEHTIKSHLDPSSSVYTTTVSEKVCGQCHAAEKIFSKYRLPSDRLKTYLESYHGLAGRHGVTTVANCASCHGAHDILPSSDPQSSVHKTNLPQTCGKCHPNVGEQLGKGSVHVAPSFSKDRIVYCVTVFYVFLIILVIGGMVLHNIIDFAAKLRIHYQRKKEESRYLRFTRSERIQHWVLFASFAVLAYTGFSLKTPEAWWVVPFSTIDAGFDWRGVVHRIAAVIFSALCLYHLFFLIVTHRGREQIRAFMPRKKDFSDLFQNIRFNLGISKEKPRFGRYGYVEKLEYWALIWGSLIMILTGVMLVFENMAMRYFPKWAIDVATTVHFYEAVLATSAIIVWHFYFTIFDPEHYPMNWSMMTGKSDEEGKKNSPGDSK